MQAKKKKDLTIFISFQFLSVIRLDDSELVYIAVLLYRLM